ncbi:MAG: OmpP1/FadL family transporter [Pseudomonadota bacterium]
MAMFQPAVRRGCALGTAGLLSLAMGNAFASGFALIEQSVSSMGTAYAGAGSIAADASTVFFNPASMSRLDGKQLSAGMHVVVPQTEFNGSAQYNSLYDNPGVPFPFPANPTISPGADNDTDAGVTGVVPHFTYVQELNERWNFGISVNVPFGLKTEYGTGWVGRYSSTEGDITTVNLNPTLSYKVDDHVTIGAGVSAMYANLIYKLVIDDGYFGGFPGLSDQFGEYDVDDWGFGWNVGILLEPSEHTRFGFAYRSGVDVNLKGDFTSTSAVAPSNSAAADVSLPGSMLLSAYHEIDPNWAVMADVMWTNWNKLQSLVLRSGSGSTGTIPLNWKDTFRYSVGASYKYDDRWTFRGGLALDKNPIPSSQFRLAALPDEDRTWLALGAGYKLSSALSFDFGYAHLFIDNARINSTDAYSSSFPFTEGLHRINGEYDASVDILSAQVNWQF